MARIDDYVHAKKIAVDLLSESDWNQLPQRAGFRPGSDNKILVPFLNRSYKIDPVTFNFTDIENESQEVPIQEQVLILHYLKAQAFPSPKGQWVSYREIPGATFYYSAFLNRAVNPLKKVFGQNIQGFERAAQKLDGKRLTIGDAAFEFYVFPKVPIRITIWEGDEDFTPEANIVFDETIGHILSAEDIAWMAGMLVYRLMALSR
ncbi:MAG: DUF3786 domain-containing protein [Desulfobacterales bacterium]